MMFHVLAVWMKSQMEKKLFCCDLLEVHIVVHSSWQILSVSMNLICALENISQN